MAVLVALLAAFATAGAPGASAAELTPCVPVAPTGPAGPAAPTGPTIKIDGEANLVTGGKAGKALRRAGVKQRLIAPASGATGRPSYPVADVAYEGPSSTVALGGGLRLQQGKRKLEFRSLVVSAATSGAASVTARYAGGTKRLFTIKGAKVKRDDASGELYLQSGSARLTAAASKAIRKRFGKRRTKTLKPGAAWATLDVYALRRVTLPPPSDPKGETPDEPPVLTRPAGAVDLASGSIEWRVRESFIRYVASGDGANPVDGASPGPAEAIDGAVPLVYEFGFPFSSGWSDGATQSSLVKGTGGVHFRHCQNTINFVVHDPEVELNGDLSRMIFRVQGTDGTAFPDSRAVMVGLKLSQAESVETVGNTTTYEKIPGYVPEGSAGIFADFYLPGAEFGSLTISVTKP